MVQPPRLRPMPKPEVPSPFQVEQRMSYGQLMQRWEPFIKKAAKRFNVPAAWIREVMRIESGGREMMAENARIVSSEGALGLMQIQPGTYAEMRQQYSLGTDPFDPHDNIYAGAAYLRWLRGKYGFPTMFEAYDDGPGHLEQRLTRGALLPDETRNYVKVVSLALGFRPPATQAQVPPLNGAQRAVGANTATGARPVYIGAVCGFTRPDGSSIFLDCTQVHAIRAPLIDEYAPEVKSVLTVGNVSQGVRETEEAARAVVLSHGGKV
jgi:transglycosylase-like protein with SLT domain